MPCFFRPFFAEIPNAWDFGWAAIVRIRSVRAWYDSNIQVAAFALLLTTNRKEMQAIKKEKPLTPKQKRFVVEYLIDQNATQAAIRAGYSPKTARQQGARLLSNADVGRVIKSRMRYQTRKAEISAERVLKEWARIAFADPRGLFESNGLPRSPCELDDDMAAAVETVEVLVSKNKNSATVKKYKLASKMSALDCLARYLGMLDGKDTIADEGKQTGVIVLPEVREDTPHGVVQEQTDEREEDMDT